MTLEGYGPYQIATQFTAEHIPIPAYHQAQLGVGLWQNREIKYPYKWTSSTIAHTLQKHEYLGHTVNFKTRKHFKDKKSHYIDKDQWLIFEDTHAPIIDQETLDNVQRIRGQVRVSGNWKSFLGGFTRTMHWGNCQISVVPCSTTNMRASRNSHRANWTITKRNRHSMKMTVRFLKLVERYSNTEEMKSLMLNEFVEKIIVHERDRKGSADTTQKIEIYFNFIGDTADYGGERADTRRTGRNAEKRGEKG